jgi:hypothetical protein
MRRVSKARVVWARILIVFQIFSFNSPLRVLSAAQPSSALPNVRSFPTVPRLAKTRTSVSNVRTSAPSVLLPGMPGVGVSAARSADALGTPPPPLPCDAPANAIVAENCLTGNPSSEWDVAGAGDPSIQGFATDISVNKGSPDPTVHFKINVNPSGPYHLNIYRMGYYGGAGARKVGTIPSLAGVAQQPCLNDAGTGLIDCGNWIQDPAAAWTVPAGATSGIYFAKAVREDGSLGASHIFFIVRDDEGHSDLLFQTSDTTWQAYNQYGGNSLYVGQPAGRAYKVSYNRPFTTRGTNNNSFVFDSEYPMVRWLEANGYNVSYVSGVDADRMGSTDPGAPPVTMLLNHQVFLSVGHDEYWSGLQRTHVEAARNAGIHLAFFSGNEMFWKTRWEASIDGSGTPHRTLVCYKETHANAKIDPNPEWTGTWRDPRFSPPADGGRPENALTGNLFMVNNGNGSSAAMQVPPAEGKTRFWRNTSVATLAQQGGTATLPPQSIGYEWDMDVSNGSRPPGLFHLSSTTVPVTGLLLADYGSTYASGVATHTLTLYRHTSGALVFGAGTIRWPWGLDATHDGAAPPVSTDMKQATVNLFADMGVQPATLTGGLVAATVSADNQAPTSTISSPVNGSTVAGQTDVVISGTASDTLGIVAGVEVSVDGGTSWHLATGGASWTYHWVKGDQEPRDRRQRQPGNAGRRDYRQRHLPLQHLGWDDDACSDELWGCERGRGGLEIPLADQRLHHRGPVLQRLGQYRDAYGPPVVV